MNSGFIILVGRIECTSQNIANISQVGRVDGSKSGGHVCLRICLRYRRLSRLRAEYLSSSIEIGRAHV